MSEEFKEVVNAAQTKAWNQCISPRLQSVSGMFSADEWTKGVATYLRFLDKKAMDKLLSGCKSRDDDQFFRGYITAIRQFLDMPEVVQRQLDKPETPTQQPYTG